MSAAASAIKLSSTFSEDAKISENLFGSKQKNEFFMRRESSSHAGENSISYCIMV